PLPELPFRVLTGDDFFAGGATVDGPPPAMHDTACIIYTSGTSGPTRGVIVPWAMLHDAVDASVPDAWGADDVWYGTAPLFHVSGKSCPLVAAHHNSRLVVR